MDFNCPKSCACLFFMLRYFLKINHEPALHMAFTVTIFPSMSLTFSTMQQLAITLHEVRFESQSSLKMTRLKTKTHTWIFLK